MAISYPTGLDTTAQPSAGQVVDSARIAKIIQMIEAIEAKCGITGSAVTTTLDYKVNNATAPRANNADINGFKFATADFASSAGGNEQAFVLGASISAAFWNGPAQTITSLGISINTGLAGGLVYMALYTSAGTLLSQTPSISAATSGFKSGALGVAQALTANTKYYVMVWNTTSIVKFSLPGTSVGVSAQINSNLAAPNFRLATTDTGLTTTAPASMGTQTGSGNMPMIGGF